MTYAVVIASRRSDPDRQYVRSADARTHTTACWRPASASGTSPGLDDHTARCDSSARFRISMGQRGLVHRSSLNSGWGWDDDTHAGSDSFACYQTRALSLACSRHHASAFLTSSAPASSPAALPRSRTQSRCERARAICPVSDLAIAVCEFGGALDALSGDTLAVPVLTTSVSWFSGCLCVCARWMLGVVSLRVHGS